MRFRSPWLLALSAVLAAGCRPAAVPVSGSSDPAAGGPSRQTEAVGTLRVSFLDIGQGDAALVQSPTGTSVLIDGGPPDAGPRVIEAIREAGISRLDWIVGSHPHSDHIGGLIDVLREVPAAQALDPGYNHGTATQRTYLKLLNEKGVKTTRARAGQTHDLGGGAKLEILAPQEPLLTGTDSDPNNNSIVARLVFGETEVLFTGDMEEDERARLLRSARPAQLQADVLKVAHHGSHNGTDAAFLQAVQPRYAVISLAKNNDYGHPHREALEALRNARVQVYRTDESGTIRLRSDGRQLVFQPGRPSAEAGAAGGPAPAPAETAHRGRVIGNESSKVYHAPDCGSLPARHRQVALSGAADAEKSGYRPHQACMR